MEKFNCNIRFAKGYNLKVLIQNVHVVFRGGPGNVHVCLFGVKILEKMATWLCMPPYSYHSAA